MINKGSWNQFKATKSILVIEAAIIGSVVLLCGLVTLGTYIYSLEELKAVVVASLVMVCSVVVIRSI